MGRGGGGVSVGFLSGHYLVNLGGGGIYMLVFVGALSGKLGGGGIYVVFVRALSGHMLGKIFLRQGVEKS